MSLCIESVIPWMKINSPTKMRLYEGETCINVSLHLQDQTANGGARDLVSNPPHVP